MTGTTSTSSVLPDSHDSPISLCQARLQPLEPRVVNLVRFSRPVLLLQLLLEEMELLAGTDDPRGLEQVRVLRLLRELHEGLLYLRPELDVLPHRAPVPAPVLHVRGYPVENLGLPVQQGFRGLERVLLPGVFHQVYKSYLFHRVLVPFLPDFSYLRHSSEAMHPISGAEGLAYGDYIRGLERGRRDSEIVHHPVIHPVCGLAVNCPGHHVWYASDP